MAIGITALIISVAYMLVLAIAYFSEERKESNANKIYSSLIITSLIGIVLELLCIGSVYKMDILPEVIVNIVNKSFLIYLWTWVSLFTVYIFFISFDNNNLLSTRVKDKQKLILAVFSIIYIICAVILVMSPLEYFCDGEYAYSFGIGTNFLYLLNGISIIIWLICLFLNIKKVGYKKYIPLFTFVVLAGINMLIREINPGITLITATQAFITAMTFFTIENPDMKMMARLNFAMSMAEDDAKAKTTFLKQMSHEISTPINKAKGMNIFNMETDYPEVNEIAKVVDEALEELVDIKTNIIDSVKFTGGRMFVEKDVYKPKELFDKVVSIFQSRMESKGLKFKFTVSKDLPDVLYGDAEKIKTVISQLLSNALKYTKKGTIDLNVASSIKNEKCILNISVKDTGIGIKKEKQKYLFKAFSRTDIDDSNTTVSGMGLGLSNAKQFLDLMNGTISVTSVENQGSTFIVQISQELIKDPK